VCSLNKQDLEAEFPFVGELSGAFADIDVGSPLNKTKATAAQLCFLSAYAFALLHHGHGFDLDRNFTVVDTMDYGGSELKVTANTDAFDAASLLAPAGTLLAF